MEFSISPEARTAVIGYGSWATALVKILSEHEEHVGWYIPNDEVRRTVLERGHNPKYLSDVAFDTGRLHVSDRLDEVVARANILVLAAPSAYLKTTLAPLTLPLDDKFVVSAIKGIVPDPYITVAEYLNEHYALPFSRIGIVTGPCHAEEVALERLSFLTVVCKENENARVLGDKFRTRYINISHSTDIYGIEYATVLKNIYAIAVGIASGLGYGDNFLAVLISNSAMELSRFLDGSYPSERNIGASAYLGDLLVTSYSMFSRNRRFGVMIGRGYTVADARLELKMIAEGYFASECITHVNARYRIPMPIAQTVHDILYRNADPRKAMDQLTRKLV